jgi:hypothetical protein
VVGTWGNTSLIRVELGGISCFSCTRLEEARIWSLGSDSKMGLKHDCVPWIIIMELWKCRL